MELVPDVVEKGCQLVLELAGIGPDDGVIVAVMAPSIEIPITRAMMVPVVPRSCFHVGLHPLLPTSFSSLSSVGAGQIFLFIVELTGVLFADFVDLTGCTGCCFLIDPVIDFCVFLMDSLL